jgi:hypothetical protein
MKKIFILLFAIGLFSCEDTFLEIPDTSGTVDLDEIYSTAKNAEAALAKCYRDILKHGWPTGWGVGHGTLGSISGERARGYNWHGTFHICESGLNVNGTDGSDAGADHFAQNWMYIRECYLVKENIDKVPDMTDELKNIIKAEATALIAYRYMGMFYRYGGIPLVDKAYNSDDDLFIGRSSLVDTYDFVLSLIEEAYNGLPEKWETKYTGRISKGAVLAMKARLQMFAARPLFNSATPYISNSGTDQLVSFGNYDSNRWSQAITVNEAVLTWARTNGYEIRNTGGAGAGQPNPNAIDDYGIAVSLPGNNEVILSYKYNETNMWGDGNGLPYYYNMSQYWQNNRFDTDVVGLLANFLENYYLFDGTTPEWPVVDESSPRPASHWLNNMEKIEPRFKVDYIAPGAPSASNPGDNNWSLSGWGRRIANAETNDRFPGIVGTDRGSGASTKFYYKAGGRTWFEPPLFRMAEIHLNLAEAYNESGNSAKALEHLNIVHNRAGLPAITETNQASLRRIIWREKAIEFMGENHRYYDVKHWKHPEIDNGIIGGQMRELQFYFTNAFGDNYGNRAESLIHYWNANTYTCYWHPKMYLEPIPQSEINKGIIVQNPGY